MTSQRMAKPTHSMMPFVSIRSLPDQITNVLLKPVPMLPQPDGAMAEDHADDRHRFQKIQLIQARGLYLVVLHLIKPCLDDNLVGDQTRSQYFSTKASTTPREMMKLSANSAALILFTACAFVPAAFLRNTV